MRWYHSPFAALAGLTLPFFAAGAFFAVLYVVFRLIEWIFDVQLFRR